MQFAVPFGQPTFRAPATARIQDEKICQVVAGEFLRHLFLIFRAQGQRKSRQRGVRAGGFGEGEIVVNFMGSTRIDFIAVKQRRKTFACVGAWETDAARGSGGECRERGFVEALKIYGAGVVRGAQFADRGEQACSGFLFEWDYFGEIGIAFEQAPPFRFDEPVNASFGKGIAQGGGGGQSVDYVAERA